VPLLAGLDEFLNLMTRWPKYVAPALAVLLTPSTKLFAYVVAAWLAGIALNLIAAGFHDIAVRDLVMAVSAISLAWLTDVVHVPVAAPHVAREPAVGSA
jgi:hypothetical protein